MRWQWRAILKRKTKKLNNDIQDEGVFVSYEFLFSKDFVDGSVTFTNWSDESADGDDAGFSQIDSSVFVEVADIELDGCVILGCDQPIGVVALSGQVEIGQFVIEVDVTFHFGFNVSKSSLFHLLKLWRLNIIIFLLIFLIKSILPYQLLFKVCRCYR